MLKERLKYCRFSGLTGVRTVSDDLSSSSGDFSYASDQTMRITKLVGEEKLDKMIHATIADFVNNPIIDLPANMEEGDYDLAVATAFQKHIDKLARAVLKNVSKALQAVEEA